MDLNILLSTPLTFSELNQPLMALRAALQTVPADCAEAFASEKVAEPVIQHLWFLFPGHTGTNWIGEP